MRAHGEAREAALRTHRREALRDARRREGRAVLSPTSSTAGLRQRRPDTEVRRKFAEMVGDRNRTARSPRKTTVFFY